MRRFLISLSLVGLLWASLPPALAAAQEPVQPHRPGELLVGFQKGVGDAAKKAVHDQHKVTVLKRFSEIGVDLVRLPPGRSVSDARRAYGEAKSVRFTDPNYQRTATRDAPNDPMWGSQWPLYNTGKTVNNDAGTSDADIDSFEPGSNDDAWDSSIGSSDVVVAVIDTGVDTGHDDLAANIYVNPHEIPANGVDDDGNGYIDDVRGWDFAHNDASVYDPSEACNGRKNDEHGTHVAGTIGAVGNNAKGIAGVNWSVRLLPLKFLAKSGANCGAGFDSDAIEAILYATRIGADVINASWGGTGPSEAMRQAFIAAGQSGILSAVAAGNSGDDLGSTLDYPASFDLEHEIVVAASDNDDGLASFSNFGGPSDLAAPGVNILSTLPANQYGYLSGTSMAAPHVAGAIAHLRSQYPHALPSEIQDRVVSNVDIRPAFALKTRSNGRLNLNTALRQIRPVIPTLIAPNGGETLAPGAAASINWETNIPAGNPSTKYRVEVTPNATASTTTTHSFEGGMPAGFSEPQDSDSPWLVSSTAARPGGSGTNSARSGAITDNDASWLETSLRLSVAGSVSFWFKVSSENCETAAQPTCGDYLRFYVDGVSVMSRAGSVGWTQAGPFPLAEGAHRLAWAYQKDPSVASGDDVAWIDDVAVAGTDAALWSHVGTTASGATTLGWTVPSQVSPSYRVRVCQDPGGVCPAEASDASDGLFGVGLITLTESGGSTAVIEAGAGDQYSVVLYKQPSANVTVSISPNSQVSASVPALQFTSANWATPQFVGVSAVNDSVTESSPHAGIIAHTVSSGDSQFNGVFLRSVSVAITDDDCQPRDGPYWSGWDIARDVALLPSDGCKGYVLDGWGGLHSFGAATRPTGGPYWGGWDIARGVALHPDGGGYVLDGWGGIHRFSVAGVLAPPVSGGPYWSGWDIARGIAVNPDGKGGYIVDGWGGIHSFSIGGQSPPAPSGGPYWTGWDIARGIAVHPGGGGYVVDGWGGTHRFSGAPLVLGGPYWPGWDIARGLAVKSNGSGGFIVDGWGGLHRIRL